MFATLPLLSLCSIPSAPVRACPGCPGGEGEPLGLPALFSWGDYDRDGDLDLAAIGDAGELCVLACDAEGHFEDVTESVGLGSVREAALALWGDFDADGGLDLFVGARAGASRVFRNEGGAFTALGEEAGLACAGPVRAAQWLDPDGDGRLDLFVVTAQERFLLRGFEGGRFERVRLDALPSGVPSPGRAPLTVLPPAGCVDSLRDQAVPGACIRASSTPELGLLYPLSDNLFVAASGNVGLGTTNPAARLEVAGPARVTDTLTLNPSGDQALSLATGSVYKAGRLFLHTKGGSGNTAVGREALSGVTSSGVSNTAVGDRALFSNTTGRQNTASGVRALYANTTGNKNTASGERALYANTSGARNTASGYRALFSNTTGANNTASGYRALYANAAGTNNTAHGYRALTSNTSGNFNTAVGDRALFSNTSGTFNTANGYRALYSNTSGQRNVACGDRALFRNTTGFFNTASGYRALFYNTVGVRNTASGDRALLNNTSGALNTANGSLTLNANTTGNENTASGYRALFANTTGQGNTAIGRGALQANSTGSANIAVGRDAGSILATGNDNIAIGHPGGAAGEAGTIRLGNPLVQTRAFVAGIRGVTTGVADAIPVMVDSAGQLGTLSSSRRFKEEIRDMGAASARLLALRPVVFRYKPEVQAGERPLEFGLIAEEVAEVFPELVVRDEEGRPLTVKYHLLSSLLLNELERLKAAHEEELAHLREELAAANDEHARELAELRNALVSLGERVERLAAGR